MPLRSRARGLSWPLLLTLCVAACSRPEEGGQPGESEQVGPAQIEPLPEFDWERSPHTGWTREHYVALFARVVAGWSAHLSPGGARSELPGDPNYPQQLEGVARMLPLLGAWLSEPSNPATFVYQEQTYDVLALASAVVLHGTDPEHPEYWGPIRAGQHQTKVEALFVAEFLVDAREAFWEPLDDEARERIMAWLLPSEGEHGNNFTLILAARDVLRRELGYPVDEDSLRARLDQFETHHVGDGWYRDGEGPQLDWYNGYVIHAQWLRWAALMGEEEPERLARLTPQISSFLHHLPYFMAEDGALPPIGRSLIYRSAALTPVAFAARFGLGPLAPGLSRRMLSGNLSYHVGASLDSTQRMLDADDLLRLGVLDEDPNSLENYQNPGAQYLAVEALTVLALPPEHAFWTEAERALPIDDGGAFVHTVPAAGFHLEGRAGLVRLDNTRSWKAGEHWSPRYAKLSYSTAHFHNVLIPGQQLPYDAMLLTKSMLGGFGPRAPGLESSVVEGLSYQRYASASAALGSDEAAPVDEVRTAAAPLGGLTIRASCVDAAPERAVEVFEGGPALRLDATAVIDEGAGWTYVEDEDGAALLAGLVGYAPPTGLEAFLDELDINLVHEQAGFVSLISAAQVEAQACFASASASAREPFDPTARLATLVDYAGEGSSSSFSFAADTSEQLWLELAAEPPDIELELTAQLRFEGPLRYARGGAGWIAAEGARSIVRGDSSLVWAALDDVPAGVSCRALDEAWVCELSGPCALGTPDGSAIDGWRAQVELDGGDWEEVELAGASDQFTIDAQQLAILRQGDRTRARLRLLR